MKLSVRDMILVAFFAALMTIGAYISKIWPPDIIPFSLLPLLSMLAGMIIGRKLGALSIVVYILVGLAGLPVFASAPYGGFTYIFKPTFGFLISFILSAYISGLLVYKKDQPGLGTFMVAAIISFVVMYIIGLPWMYLVYNFYLGTPITFLQIAAMMGLYMGLDFLKAIIAALVGKTMYERIGGWNSWPRYNLK
ncbi:MAG: biotin transporter BioY [Bacillota bacterium]